MMLTIQGLPTNTSYQELKRLIKQECNITDFILDSLVMDDDGCKKVRIGVTDDGDGNHLMKYLNGYHYSGHVIRVLPVGKPNQGNQGNFDTRGGYQQRNDYSGTNFGNRAMPHESQPPRSNTWGPNVQWGQGMVAPVPQNTFPNQPIQSVVNNNFTQQPRAFGPGGVPQHAQNFGYGGKGNVLETPVATLKDNFQGSNQFHHQPVGQGHFQGQTQPSPWATQVQPVKPQVFDKPTTGGYNQMGFNDNRQIPKQGVGNDSGYKDYDKGDRRFAPPIRDPSPGRRPTRMSPEPMGRRISPTGPQGRRMSPSGSQGRRISPSGHQGRRLSPGNHGRRMSPSRMGGSVPTGRMSPISGRRMSPTRQGMSPHGRKLSPAAQGRRVSPGSYRRASSPRPQGRRMSPPGPQGRRMSPTGPQDRRMSPPGSRGQRDSPHGIPVRRMSPSGRRISPGRREPSPVRRMSPNRRRGSPGRQSPGRRASPKRHSPDRRSRSPRSRSPLLDDQARMRGYPPLYQQSKKSKYDDDERPPHLKQIRPAYEPSAKAPNQAMYSGGYRPNAHENMQYPAPNVRLDPWQQSSDKSSTYPPTKIIDGRMENFEMPRGSEHMRIGDAIPKRSRSSTRDSRSPVRRDRSPFKDRYRRHSPSPRSPRRSWALEKRRSPDVREAPPPPVWPGQISRDADFPRQNRQHFSDVTEKIDTKSVPGWDRPSFEKNNDGRMDKREKDPEPRPFAQNKIVLEKWKSLSQASPKEYLSRESFRQEERFPENIRDSHRYTLKEQFRRPNSVEHMSYYEKRDFKEYPTKKDDNKGLQQKKDITLRRDDYFRGNEGEPFRANTAQLNQEIEDVYKRVAELGKKAQEYRKKESRFDDDRGDQIFSQEEDEMQRRRDTRREFITDTRFQPRDEETLSGQSNEGKPSSRQRESRWSAPDTSEVWRPKKPLSPTVKAKRDKAAEEITRRLMNKFQDHIREHQKTRVHDELTLSISHILFDMFKYEDISYIELIIKFNKKYDSNEEQKIFEEVMSSFSSNYRKRLPPDLPEVPVKTSKLATDAVMKEPPRKVNAAPDNRSFLTPKAKLSIKNLNSKHVPESKVRSQEHKLTKIESKPLQAKTLVAKPKILITETNHQGVKISTKKELKRLTQKSPGGVKKLTVQKKKILAALKTKASVQKANAKEIVSTPKITKITKVSDLQIQKTKPQESTATVQKNKPQETTPATHQIKPENDISNLKNKAQDNDTCIQKIKTTNNSKAIEDTKPQDNASKTKNPAPENAPKINSTARDKKPQELQNVEKEPSADSVKKQRTDQSKTETSVGEKCELDPILARAVEEALQDIMIQVWQELPDDPRDEEDRIAVDKLRNEVGDDLRRVLGLNITKRLLNVYNNLFVKLQFTCRPQMGCLTSFLQEYHISKFKRIDSISNTFAAQMDTIEDFDKLCAVKQINCGEAKVTIIPCYKFTQCPENLKTIYDDTYFYEHTQENTESSKNKKDTQKVDGKVSNENIVKLTTKTENIEAKSTDKTKSINKDSNNVAAKSIDRTVGKEIQKSANAVCNDFEGITKEITSAEREKISDSLKIVIDDTKPKEKQSIDNAVNEKYISKDAAKDKDICDYIIKDKLESDDDDFASGVPECEMEGEDELDDEDILALMSEGVVLDECSGSEDEN